MSVNRTPELLAGIQWDVEDHTEPLTLYANRTGTFIVEPGCKPVPVDVWLREPVA